MQIQTQQSGINQFSEGLYNKEIISSDYIFPREMKQEKVQGVIKMWNIERGFGFVQVGTYPKVEDFFLHISSCLNDYQPEQGDCVLFKPKLDSRRGNLVASEAQATGQYIKASYFSHQRRRQIRRELREKEQNQNQERFMNSQSFKNDYYYERKEGYHCKRCHRQFVYTPNYVQCSCKNWNYDD